jgi:hypothetical protein
MMLNRCLAEAVKRGSITLPEEPWQDWYTELADRFAISTSEDLLIGTNTVREASIELILNVSRAASRRVDVLNALIEYLGGEPDAGLQLE